MELKFAKCCGLCSEYNRGIGGSQHGWCNKNNIEVSNRNICGGFKFTSNGMDMKNPKKFILLNKN